MSNHIPIIDIALEEVKKCKELLSKKKSRIVESDEETNFLKSTLLAWINSHRVSLSTLDSLSDVDELYRILLAFTAKRTSRKKYLHHFRNLKNQLIAARGRAFSVATKQFNNTPRIELDFTRLTETLEMREILKRRVGEIHTCIDGGAPLSATVMMGGLLEAIFLARINQLTDKAPIFTASSSPRDAKGTPLKLNEWTLRNYIDVASDLKWISQSAKSVSEVLRDFRNYIHPHKELSHGVSLLPSDAKLFWTIVTSIAQQIERDIKNP